ncbi:tsaC protein (YrdC domain) required for threonylcarbamoyladenosine t(6)A37 modification in tRNA [Halarchaeum acidiphilum MH1-52-1]|uniref:L-threonylcarbamoyladenylate synthase n=1 Tax=Halarchaeum acidiphilum MH1-52-1 TaxID=1261545 RepID=U3A0U8_9EURY|nr:L-threonylcarbamoyladenylate synthase [Halarchaeum acidiphilum]GAD51269.1 tsaC protein (YrdC domain) required for threonylcarbamoyladenosine t(6)A37 modification in tRNA [Halarchaeum acidiphilum MH1-52-1]
MNVADPRLDAAADAIRDGDLVVYPTETVYGLGADALDSEAIERAYAAKGRERSKPMSLGVPDVETASDYVVAGERERAFMRAFLPGPVTVVCEKRDAVPDALTGGRERVGVRVPDHEVALALLERVAPVTATSANVSGTGSVRRAADLDPGFLDDVAVVLDGGETGGVESTVVDVANDEILREGANAAAIAEWLDER